MSDKVMNQNNGLAWPTNFHQLHWLFRTYLDGNSERDGFLNEEVKQNNGSFKPLLKQEMEQFLKYRPLRHSEYEREYQTDFASEKALYDYVGILYEWLYGDSKEPDLLPYLAT
ncbi:hypothetical protein JJJ17_19325 [Paracoccus caeni]|uniref:Uncharacterized protein n=1 Tax=Paracoccus caeni TaxID=657651 RepID=A0A934W1J2_9RHOB|nr:hypothetical protein [Paracoccus caeni]MBK4218085.1 hypothetical protein [Paracoccus caeni]